MNLIPFKKTTENIWKYTEDGDHYLLKTITKFSFLGIYFYSSVVFKSGNL